MSHLVRRHLTQLSILLLGIVGLFAARPSEAQQQSNRQVILISIDGLTTMDYLNPDGGLKVPNLEALKANGCAANGMKGVFPTVTYPSHTAMITGEPPAVHGIYTNTPLDPFGYQGGGWFYFAEQITAPTLWQVMRKAGLKTAAVSWPVTIGAEVDYLLPEWRPIRTREDAAMLAALSTPGLFHEMIKVDPDNRPMTDAWRTNVTMSILDRYKPDLLALHLSDLDGAQHANGPHTPQAHAALEKIDSQIGEIRAAVARSGRADQTAWVIVSDHGFYPVNQVVNPMIALRDAGLITTNEAGRVTDWKVFMHNAGGSALFEVRDPNDAASIAKTNEIMRKLAADPANGILKVYTPEELKALEGAPEAFLGMEAVREFGFGSNMTGPMVTPAPSTGKHGYNPNIPELRAAMILSGAGVNSCQQPMEGVRMVDVAPTVAGLLGVPMTGISGRNVNAPRPR